MTQETTISRFCPSVNRNRSGGFTLIELAVALTIILMMVVMVVPTMSKMMSSRASMEAFNLVAAQLSAARAEAITSNTYAGIHVQLDEATEMADKVAYSMIIAYDEDDSVFRRHNLFVPQELPGRTALGRLIVSFITGSPAKYRNLHTDLLFEKFCAFSVIFSPEGTVVTKVGGSYIKFDSSDPMFNGTTQLWDFGLANGRDGVTAFTMFDYLEVMKREGTDRATYLDENGQFMPVNMHTGQLFDRQ
jgi:hypothetical protein